MEENNGCVILKKKEYRELMEKARRGEDSDISVGILYDFAVRRDLHIAFSDKITLSSNVYKQIRRIMKRFIGIVDKYFDDHKDKVQDAVEDELREKVYKKIANMSWIKRRKILKQYKNK